MRGAGRARRLFRPPHASPVTPSDTSLGRWERRRKTPSLPSWSPSLRGARQCCPGAAGPRCLPPGKSRICPREGLPERCSRWPAGAGAARVHRCAKTSTRPFSAPLFAGASRPRALPRLLQMVVSTSTTVDRSNIPLAASPRQGQPPVDREPPFAGPLLIDGSRRRYAGSGVEEHRTSTLPLGIAPESDFAPTPIASGASCRERRPTPRLELTRGRQRRRRSPR
jgi:hypothetical protein